jgi:histidine triad (HIT) family protein
MSLFTKIINGELPCYKIFEDELTFSFLALDQVTRGHTLVIPKQEVNHWIDVPPEIYSRLHLNAQKIGKAVHAAMKTPRIITAMVGFEVPHCHLHLIPSNSVADLNFSKGKRLASEEMSQIQKEILQFL